MLHLMGLYAFDRLRQLQASAPAEHPRISTREREVLQWVAQGKSAWEVGEILSITKRTLTEHMRSVTEKLGAVNRAHAVAIALRERLIDA